MSIVRAERVDFQIAPGVFLEFYRLPDGEKRIGLTSAAVVCGHNKNYVGQLSRRTPSHLRLLQDIGYTGDVIEAIVERTTVGSKGASLTKTISFADFKALVMFSALKLDKKEAKGILMALAGVGMESIKRVLGDSIELERTRSGFVYLVKVDSQSRYKIGMTTTSVEKRLASLQTASPHKLHCVWSKFFSDAFDAERFLHCQFESMRVSGEWFDFGRRDEIDVQMMITLAISGYADLATYPA